MGNGFWLAIGQMCQLCFWTVRYLPRGDWRQLPRRTLMFGITIPVLLFFQLLHWVGFGLDELFFRKYRQVKITKPLFVTGIPRSGTTHLQRVLATHESLTCMKMWECLLAPSIAERYVYRSLGRILRPISRLIHLSKLPFFQEMGAVHSLGLLEEEEDFIALLPINACFLLVMMFPEVKSYWRLVRFDSAMSEKQKSNVIDFYTRVIQKHLYYHGANKRYLCKNPSFLSWLQALKQSFPDAGFVICERCAERTIPSQISALGPTWQLLYGEPMSPEFVQQILFMLADYYHDIDKLPLAALNAKKLKMDDLVADLPGSVRAIAWQFDLPITEAFMLSLEDQARASANYKSQHTYREPVNFNWRAQRGLFPELSWGEKS